MKKKVCMVVQDKMVKGGIAAVISGYYGSELETKYDVTYVESYKDGGKLTKLIKGISGYISFSKNLIINKPELVHIHSSFGPSFYRKLPFIYMSHLAGVPIINHIHGADFDEFYINASEKKKKLIRNTYAKCERLIALSSEWKERLSQLVDPEKIVIIENYSILHEEAFEQRKVKELTANVLFLGELGKRKGCYDIPYVVKKVVEQVPTAMFYLCGAGSVEDENNIKHLCEEQGIIDHVVFPGWIRDKKKDDMLRNADVFFLPSYNEGMPMSVLDAMGYGLPVVSTNVGGIPKIVRNGKNGYCCEAGNIEALAEGIISLLTNDEQCKSFSQGSMEIIRSRYSLEYHLGLLEALYENVININER